MPALDSLGEVDAVCEAPKAIHVRLAHVADVKRGGELELNTGTPAAASRSSASRGSSNSTTWWQTSYTTPTCRRSGWASDSGKPTGRANDLAAAPE